MSNFIQRILAIIKKEQPKKPEILIIENRFHSLEFLKNTLFRKYTVLIAQDKDEGLNRARIHKPSIIILNSKLYKEGTLSLCADLRKLDETKNIPILMIAEKANDSNIEEFYKYKIEGFLVEPFSKEELLIEVKLAFNKRK